MCFSWKINLYTVEYEGFHIRMSLSKLFTSLIFELEINLGTKEEKYQCVEKLANNVGRCQNFIPKTIKSVS